MSVKNKFDKDELGLWRVVSKPLGFKVSTDRANVYAGFEASLRVRSESWDEWTLEYNDFIPVEPEDGFCISVYMKTKMSSRSSWIALEPVPLDEAKSRVRAVKKVWRGDPGEPFTREDLRVWRGGLLATSGTWDWRFMPGFFIVPNGGAYLGLRLKGAGPGVAWVTGVSLTKGLERFLKPSKPPPARSYPGSVLYRRLKLGSYAGKVLRVGDLNRDRRVELLFAQKVRPETPEHSRVKYAALSCLTAVDLNGDTLWQIGEPDLANYDVWSDLPVQLFDFDRDGFLEVLCCKDFKIKLLDGATGEVLKEADTPKSNPGEGWGEGPEDSFPRILGDSITICNLTGDGPGDFILKDRYNNLWAYDRSLRRLWSYTGKTGHYAQVYDVDADGFDEVFSGDALIDHDGRVIWRIDLYRHCDSSVFYRLSNGRLMLAVAHEDGGFYFLDALTGRIVSEWHLGHGQGVNLASYRPDQPGGLALAANTFWGGAFWFMLSLEGKILEADFSEVYGWVPVNWSGDGIELIASPYGLYDGYGRLAVEFPEPHPGKAWVYNVCGDPRDEVIVWNDQVLSIYTQDRPFQGKRMFKPKRRLYNHTFYGSFISEPAWTELGEDILNGGLEAS